MTSIAPTLQGFFTERLIGQRRASSRTIASYRDSLKLLLTFAQQRTGKPPNALDWADLDAELITAFLDHLETQRHNTRQDPQPAADRDPVAVQLRGTAPPRTRRAHPAGPGHPRQAVRQAAHLTSSPRPRSTPCWLRATHPWEGRRDRALLLVVAAQTGLRVSELTGLNCGDVTLGTGASVRCLGKGRKHRAVPLTTPTQAVLRVWMTEHAGLPSQPLFPTRTGRRLSPDAVQRLTRQHAATAARRCPSIRPDKLHPHILRHSCAMRLLHAGVDTAVIALWLGQSRHPVHQHLLARRHGHKERAIDLTSPASTPPGRYQPPDPLLAFLESL